MPLYPHDTPCAFFIIVPNTPKSGQSEWPQRLVAVLVCNMLMGISIGTVTWLRRRLRRALPGYVPMQPSRMWTEFVGRVLNQSTPDADVRRTLTENAFLMIVSWFGLIIGIMFGGFFYSTRLQRPEFAIRTMADIGTYGVEEVVVPYILTNDSGFQNWWTNQTRTR